MTDPTHRFTSRVDYYRRYRPTYPESILELMRTHNKLYSSSRVADVGSGTGLLAQLFLQHGNPVCAVEPNAAMRAAAEENLQHFPNFHSIAGRAEDTTLPAASIDLVTAGQAFHWFDAPAARREFARILVPGGHAALIWNERRQSGSPFAEAYEKMLRAFAPDYASSPHTHIDPAIIARFFAPASCREFTLDNQQLLDWPALRGRLLSSSYVPEEGHPNHDPILRELRRIYEACNENGEVKFEYETRVYIGQL